MPDDEWMKITLRLPVALRDRIARVAEANRRSVTAEIVYRLEKSASEEASEPAT